MITNEYITARHNFATFCRTYTNLPQSVYGSTDIAELAKHRIVITDMPLLEKLYGGYQIDHVKELIFVHGKLSEENFSKIKKVDALEFSSTDVPQHLSFKDIVFCDADYNASPIYNLRFNNCNIMSLADIHSAESTAICISNCKEFNIIHSDEDCFDLNIIDCSQFRSLQQCKINFVFKANFTDLRTLYDCCTQFANLRIDCYSLDCYRNIDNIDVLDSLHLFNFSARSLKNTINILNSRVKKITFGNYLTLSNDHILSVFVNILQKYINKENRSEYIMDCVIDLLENNLESAAEL